MTLETLRKICLGFPDATEDIKWGQDLAFSVGGKMFCVVNTEPPHQISFKASPERFAELVERPGMRPAPYLARAMWVQEERLGEALDQREFADLAREAYDLVRAKLPKNFGKARTRTKKATAVRRSRSAPAAARRRRR